MIKLIIFCYDIHASPLLIPIWLNLFRPFYAPVPELQSGCNSLRLHCLFKTKTRFSFVDKH